AMQWAPVYAAWRTSCGAPYIRRGWTLRGGVWQCVGYASGWSGRGSRKEVVTMTKHEFTPTPVTMDTPADRAHAVAGRLADVERTLDYPRTDSACLVAVRGTVTVVVHPWGEEPGSGWGMSVDATGV